MPPTDWFNGAHGKNKNKNEGMMVAARLIPLHINMTEEGTWTTSGNIQRCQLRILCPKAQQIGIHFNNFALPQGARLYAYSEQNKVLLGPFTSEDNPNGNDFSIGLLPGEAVILEYEHPKSKSSSTRQVSPQPKLDIQRISYVFQKAEFLGQTTRNHDYGASAPCEINANCTEGKPWRTQQKGIAHIYVIKGNEGGFCTGTLINNTANDSKPYLLTADHCGGNASEQDLRQWIFTFGYESEGCQNNGEPNGSTIVGAKRIARSTDTASSDFLLLELDVSQQKLSTMDITLNGWDRSAQSSSEGFCFHHPAGDTKKISVYEKNIETVTYPGSEWPVAPDAHWKTIWAETENGHGITEQGSSGAPLFNQHGNVIGTLTGGTSYCEKPENPDYFGKFSYHWNQNSEESYNQLAPWLDPMNTGVSSCEYLKPLQLNISQQITPHPHGDSIHFSDITDYRETEVLYRRWSFPGGNPSVSDDSCVSVAYPKPGTYDIQLQVWIQGGPTYVKTESAAVEILGYPKRFKFDFENIADFSVDQVHPCSTRDMDKSPTYTLDDVEFPNQGYTGSFLTMNYMLASPSGLSAYKPHSGRKMGICMASTEKANDDWFILPPIVITDSSYFEFWVKSGTDLYKNEEIEVYTIDQDGKENCISGNDPIKVPFEWTRFSYDLDSFAHDTVQVAIRCVSDDAFALFLDDLFVGDNPSLPFPSVDFNVDTIYTSIGEPVIFQDIDSIPDRKHFWIFDGGNPETSTKAKESVTYSKSGIYGATLIVNDGEGERYRIKPNIVQVTNPEGEVEPSVEFSCNQTEITEGDTVRFEEGVTGTPIAFLWKFEGGIPQESTEEKPKVKYPIAGIYDASLTVFFKDGSRTEIKENLIECKQKTSSISGNISPNFTFKPNPVHREGYLSSSRNGLARIYDYTGRMVLEQNISIGINTFDFGSFTPGLYILEVIGQNQEIQYIKVLVNHHP